MKTDTHDAMMDQDQIRREAQAWLRRLASGEATQLDIQGFRRWREKSPLHWSTFTEAKHLWKTLEPALADVAQREVASVAARPAPQNRSAGSRHGRRAFLGFAGGAAAAAGAAVVYPPLGLWPTFNEWQADYRTVTGEQRMLALADGVSLELNTQTSVNRLSAQGDVPAGIKLISGEAAIDLTGSAQVFSVKAGAGRSIAQASRFEVRNLENKVCVTCIEGEVVVEHALGKRKVHARQQVVYDSDNLSAPTAVSLADWSAWRKGTLVFWQTPLDKVVAEINRYRPGKVVLLASHLSNRAVSGRFAIASLDTVLLQIQQSYDLKAHTLPNGILVLS